MLRLLCILTVLACPASAERHAKKQAEKLKQDYRSIPPDHAFYLAAKLAGQAVLDSQLTKAKQTWHSYIKTYPKQKYALPAAIQIAFIYRIGAGGAEESDKAFRRIAASPVRADEDLLAGECREIARRWLVTTQMNRLRRSLELYYSANIEFPKQLELLVKAGLATSGDLRSPWGTAFSYRLSGNSVFAPSDAQAYVLAPKELSGPPLKTGDALKQWVGLLPQYVLWGVGTGTDGRPMALIGKIERGSEAGSKASVLLGDRYDGLKLVQADKVGAVLASDSIMLVLPQRTLPTGE